MSTSEEKNNIFSEWLEKLQQESWQLELLISGFALFGVWESKDWILQFIDYIDVNGISDSSAVIIFKLLGLLMTAAWSIFFINLLLHVILRGLWIGAIGLRYVSGDIDYEKLDFSETFDSYFRRRVGQFDKYIERLEKVCSVIFAYTFLLFFIFLSTTLFFIYLFLIGSLAQISSKLNIQLPITLVITLFSLFGLVVFIDFISLGSLKRVQNKSFAKVYKYIYRFYSFITLSFIYRPLLYNFIDYKYTRHLFWFSIPYVFLIVVIAPNFFLEANSYFPKWSSSKKYNGDVGKQILHWNYYDNLREQNLAISDFNRKAISTVSLGSSEMTGSHGKLFLRQRSTDKNWLDKHHGLKPYRQEGLSHRIFSNQIKDSIITALEDQRASAMVKILKARSADRKNNPEKVEKDKSSSPFQKGIELGKHGHRALEFDDYWQNKIDSTSLYWENRIEREREKKLLSIKKGMLELNQISLDNIPYNDQLSCKFYIHPNLKEKGLLCYFPIDSLSSGEHILTIERYFYNKKRDKALPGNTIHLPFWKINH